MKLELNFRTMLFSCLMLAIFTLGVAVVEVTAQSPGAALHRGYRTGYSDGYMAGYRDSIDNIGKDHLKHGEYTEAKRAYSKDYGSLEDYSDGYRQGFETGYVTGYDKKSFESAVPSGLAFRGITPPAQNPVQQTVAVMPETQTIEEPKVQTPEVISEPIAENKTTINEPQPLPEQTRIEKVSYIPQDDAIIIIPRDTELIIEIDETLDTEKSSVGDKFTARIMSPNEIAGAVIEGRIDRITKPGRIKRRAEMLLSFDRIVLTDERWANFDAVLTEVLPVKGDNVRMVDNEGTAVGKRSLKEDAIKIGATTGAGLGIGAITAGPVGAAVGAGVGAAFGVGAVVIERGKHIKLNRNHQLRIRTSYEVKIR